MRSDCRTSAQLPELGISISEAKALRIFRKCDTDGGGEIDLTEFKMAMFTVDPVSGNALGFSPSSLLNPRDAFDLFDGDATGKIDELEFAVRALM
jgi:Ca2+-binding EF-hand superfamily protein